MCPALIVSEARRHQPIAVFAPELAERVDACLNSSGDCGIGPGLRDLNVEPVYSISSTAHRTDSDVAQQEQVSD